MRRISKLFPLIILLVGVFSSFNSSAQSKSKLELTQKREAARKALHQREALMRSLTKSDTSINSLLQRVEQYTTTFNQISNNLADGLDTLDVSEQLPPVIKRIDKISAVAKTHKASTLRYLFVIRDNLDHIQEKLDTWQTDLDGVNTKLAQNEQDLLKFYKDSVLKTVPADSLVRKTFFTQLNIVKLLWHQTVFLPRAKPL